MRIPTSIVMVTGGLALVCSANVLNSQDSTAVGDARAALEQWVQTKRIISQEKSDWVLGKEMLTSRIELMQHEIETLRTKVRDAEATIDETDLARAELIEENERLKGASLGFAEKVAGLESRTLELLPRLPDPIRERIKPLSQRWQSPAGDAAQPRASLAERYQNVLGILNEINKFNREVMLTSEVRTLPNGASAQVTAIYIGIGQGYYLTADGKGAGIGTASATEWVWRPANDAAPAIARAIAILKNEQPASFVRLPIEVH